jgi:hypothetical protein
MVKRIAAGGVVTFVLWAACCASGQNADQSLPDAPSVRAAAPAELNVFNEQVHSTFKISGAGSLPQAMRPNAFRDLTTTASRPTDTNNFLAKFLYPGATKGTLNAHAAESSGFMGRATHAAAGIFFTRDESGRGRLNTSYFVRALSSVAADTASRPYWRRSPGEPLSDFGSTVGNDAGLNLLHEFGPGIQHVMKSHAPKFVGRIIGGRIGRN